MRLQSYTYCVSQHIDKVDYRKNIFLFLSNSGGKEITQVVLDRLVVWGRIRLGVL